MRPSCGLTQKLRSGVGCATIPMFLCGLPSIGLRISPRMLFEVAKI